MTAVGKLLESSDVRRLSTPIPGRNLLHLCADYLCVAVIQIPVIIAFENAAALGLGPVSLGFIAVVTIILTGIFQHRIALLGHESSHMLLLRNRKWNDFAADLLCFFPIWSSLSNYRRKHGAHHLYPNEPKKDPNLGSDRAEALFASFPLNSPRSIYKYYLLFFWPPFVIGNLVDIVKILVFGNSRQKETKSKRQRWVAFLISPGFLGLAYLLALIAVLQVTRFYSSVEAQIWIPIAFHLIVGNGTTLLLPKKLLERGQPNLHYPARTAALMRINYCAVILMGTTWSREFVGVHLGFYYFLFWLVPLFYVFPYLMLLREIYQHANLGMGKLDNSRIIHADPFTEWILLPYGNDFHLIHHLYPSIPHYRLRETHQTLLEKSEVYRQQLVEVSGNVHGDDTSPSVADSLATLFPHETRETGKTTA